MNKKPECLDLVSQLKKENELLVSAIQVKDHEYQESRLEIARLKAQIVELKRQLYGQSRERFVGNTEELPMEGSEETKATQKEKLTCQRDTTRKSQIKHPGRAKLPDHLPIEEIEIHPKGDLSAMVCIGKEIKDVLACVPTKYYIKRYIRYKYAPKNKTGKPVNK